MIDYILYMDTDSLFINIGALLDNYIGHSYKLLPYDQIINHISKISHIIEDHINEKAYKEIQRKAYNSPITDFRIKFKQEVIAQSALFIKKKKYSLWHAMEEGVPVDRIKTTGLEIIRSDTPELVRPMLREIMEMILKNFSDEDISKKVKDYKKILSKSLPEEIAVNIGVHDITDIDEDDSCKKGTPWHVKGIANYQSLLKELKLEKQYEAIEVGNKVKVVYIKKNPYGYEAISFLRWPHEFNKMIQVDFQKMIEKTFLNKISTLLEPMGKQALLEEEIINNLGTFFDL